MSDETGIAKPTETIHQPAPSWAPVVFTFGLLGLLAGAFASGFMFPPLWFAIAGAFLVLFALRAMVFRGIKAFYALPRDQEAPRAEIPVESFRAPSIED